MIAAVVFSFMNKLPALLIALMAMLNPKHFRFGSRPHTMTHCKRQGSTIGCDTSDRNRSGNHKFEGRFFLQGGLAGWVLYPHYGARL